MTLPLSKKKTTKLRILTASDATSIPVSMSHSLAVRSILPVATNVLWGLNAKHTCNGMSTFVCIEKKTHTISAVCPRKVWKHFPVSASQSCTVRIWCNDCLRYLAGFVKGARCNFITENIKNKKINYRAVPKRIVEGDGIDNIFMAFEGVQVFTRCGIPNLKYNKGVQIGLSRYLASSIVAAGNKPVS